MANNKLINELILATENNKIYWQWDELYNQYSNKSSLVESISAKVDTVRYQITSCLGVYTFFSNSYQISYCVSSPFSWIMNLGESREQKLFKLAKKQNLVRLGLSENINVSAAEVIGLVGIKNGLRK